MTIISEKPRRALKLKPKVVKEPKLKCDKPVKSPKKSTKFVDALIKKVGVSYIHDGIEKPVFFLYRDVISLDEWVDASKYHPGDYDLVLLKLENGITRVGWHSGFKWDGLKLEESDKILYWKRKQDD